MLTYVLAFGISLAAVLALMPKFIEYLKRMSLKQTISEYSLEEDQKKAGTPIMGGVLFIIVPIIAALLLAFRQATNMETIVVLLAFAGYGLIGFTDDWLIAVKKNNDGLKPAQKFAMQLVLAVIFFFLYREHAGLNVVIPFTGHSVNFGPWYFLLIVFMFTGASNAVNLTDGMDGLAAGCSIIALIPYLIVAMMQHKEGIAVFIFALLGALLGYLYYNKKPARVFMGDTGSLALGGVLAALAMVTKRELALVFIGGIFVVETICVIIQQVAVRTVHKRVFTYTPIHYAFRIKGMKEEKVVLMFWAAELIFALIGLWIALN